ncbi:jg16983 [Pararge aegeria aegeria]|uniref:Jg16983 protein n=1 Tax=Pararge aegeria aegeria TaxID=348720 RepID=A0A8S4RHK8_9NEOP|nr:jg16983 [Pararge aegeria aegeria]
MYIHYTLGAIFIVFILCVHCDNAATNNEIVEIHVPSAPQNVTANRVTATEIHLLWAPPITYTTHVRSNPTEPIDKQTSKPGSEPNLTVIAKEQTQADEPKHPIYPIDDHLILDTPINQERPKDIDYTYNLYRNDERKYNNQFSESDILYRSKREELSQHDRWRYNNEFSKADNSRNKRDTRSHRHRKRRQDSVTEKIHFERSNDGVETHQAFELPIEVVKKSMSTPLKKDITQIAYVLYYEEGVSMKKGASDFLLISGVQTSEQVKRKNVFRSDLGIQDYLNATKNLTLLNTSGAQSSKLVGFRLRNLKPFTPYKIWVRAFYNFPLEGVMSSDLLQRLGPNSEALYVLTDVKPPSAPVILNLTCEQPNGVLYLQWHQPREYDNSLDQYVVTLRKIPEEQPRTRLTLPTNKDDIETTISVKVELWNVTRYEVKIYAVTLSVASPNTLINGSESPPQEVSSELCSAHSEAMSPADVSQVKHSGNSLVALLATALLTILAAVSAALVYWRCRSRVSKCISAAYNYLEEGGERAARAPLNTYKKPVVNCSPLVSCAGGNGGATAEGPAAARPPRMAGAAHPLVRARQFPTHVASLHADGDIGFSKEYEIVVSKSATSGHTSHHSYRPENRLKNRYLNITAYDHSRVCVSSGGRCGAAGCVGAGRGASCDYVNANFIDGMLPALNPQAARRIEKKLERRARPNRQPSVKASKPPPNLAEGIESAFLNIEFSGIVESEDQAEDSDSERSDEDSELDDVYVDISKLNIYSY